MKAQQAAIPFSPLRLVIIACIYLIFGGCDVFGDGSDRSETSSDICEDVFNRYVSQDQRGLGVTSTQCAASDRGQWIEGRCYCHGENE